MNRSLSSAVFFLLCISLLLCSTLACSLSPLPLLSDLIPDQLGMEGQEPIGGDLDPEELEAALNAETVDHRPGVMEYLGMPDAFDISIVEVEGRKIRKESWRYFQYGTRVDFVEGEAVLTVEIEPVQEGTFFAAWYDPLAFEAGMTVNEVTRVIRDASPADAEGEQISLSPGGEDLTGGSVLAGDQILVGFYQGRLVYVETIALVPEGGQQ